MGNEIMMQAFEWYLPDDGNYYKNLTREAKNLKEKGIDALWLAPMFKATGTNDVGYGVYDLYDLGEFDQKGSVRTKYGTVEELKKLIEVLHKNDIKVYADVILNHKAGADFSETFKVYEVDPNDRAKRITDAYDIEAWTGFDFKGRNGKYSEFVWHFQHFNGVDFDNKQQKKAIFEVAGENKGFSKNVSNEKGNFDYLMFADIDHKNPDVKDELFRWGEWFVNYVNVDGFRYDALKHIDDEFIIDFTKHIQNVVNRDFYFFGEYWLQDKDNTNHYLYDTKYDVDLFDVALHFNMYSASKMGDKFDMRKIFDNTLVQEHPTIAVTFVDNHDSEPGQSLESFV
ncbi:MAG: alpha-amylase, partial [Finegoldia magna]|nr:alpha-amylase [Finegoldia magna]